MAEDEEGERRDGPRVIDDRDGDAFVLAKRGKPASSGIDAPAPLAEGTMPSSHELPIPDELSHELFLGPSCQRQDGSFDASSFLCTRKHMNLDDLRSDLRTYLAGLRHQLVAIINSDYEDFINLGGSHLLGSEDQMTFRMRKPLENISREIRDAMDELGGVRAGLKVRMAKRDEIRGRKAMCRKLLGVNEQLHKVEDMLRIPSETRKPGASPSAAAGSHGGGPGSSKDANRPELDRSMGSETRRLERTAQEYNQLLYLVRKSEGLKFTAGLQPRIERISLSLEQELSNLLSSTIASIQSPPPGSSLRDANASVKSYTEALTDLFRTYASIQKFREAEDVVRKQLVAPFVTRTIHREALLSPQSPMMPITPFAPLTGLAAAAAAGTNPLSPATPSFPFNSTPTISIMDDRSFIPPFYHIETIPASSSTTTSTTGSASDTFLSDALVELYNKLLSFISRDLGIILEITERRPAQGREPYHSAQQQHNNKDPVDGAFVPGSPATRERARALEESGYEVLSNVVWNEIAERLMGELSHLLFSAGRPDVFHRNYLATVAFVSRIESLCPSYRHLTILRNNPTYIAFMKRWQLPVYFQLRFKEIVGSLENSLSSTTIAPAPSAVQSTSLIMSSSEAVHRAIWTSWSDGVFLPELAGRFWRLTLQILSRYRTWIIASLPEHMATDGPAQTVQGGPSSALNPPRLLPGVSRPVTPHSGASANSDDQTDETVLRQISIVTADVHILEKLVLQQFSERIQPKLPKAETSALFEISESDGSSPQAVLSGSLGSITSIVKPLLQQVIAILAKRCSEPLRLVRSGASQVRSSTRSSSDGSSPSEPSYFVANILRPVRLFLDGPGRVLQEENKLAIVSALFEEIASRYEAALLKMKESGDALRRLKKGRVGFSLFGGGRNQDNSNSASAEDEKIRLQMSVDVEAFAKDAGELRVDLENSKALRGLRAVIEEWNK